LNERMISSPNCLQARGKPRACFGGHALKPGAHQREVGGACRQQGNGERDVHPLDGGIEGRSHDDENIGRFWSGSLARYFSGDSGLVYDSGTPGFRAETASIQDPILTGA